MNDNIHDTGNEQDDDLRAEYNFSGGIRGKYSNALQNGYSIRIRNDDGSVTEETVTPLPRTVVLDPDVFAFFSDSEAVNHALRTLIELVPQKRST